MLLSDDVTCKLDPLNVHVTLSLLPRHYQIQTCIVEKKTVFVKTYAHLKLK